MKLSEIVSEFLLDCEASGLSESTIKLYRWHLDKLQSHIGLSELAPHNLRTFFASLRKTYTTESILNFWRGISKFCTWSVRHDHLITNPMTKLTKPRQPQKLPKFLDKSQVKKLLSACTETTNPERDYTIVCLLIDTGIRRGELANLTIHDIDTTSGLLTIRGAKWDSVRRIPITQTTLALVRIWLVVRKSKIENQSLFGLTGEGLQQLMKRLSKKSGVIFSAHGLRHTMATHYDGALDDLSKMLGHRDITTTAEIYRHREVEKLQAVHEKRSALTILTNNTADK